MERGKYQPIGSGRGDGLTQAVELVASTVIFALLGGWLDGRLGTRPVLTISLAVLALAANVAKLYYGYVARMAAEEKDKPWAQSS